MVASYGFIARQPKRIRDGPACGLSPSKIGESKIPIIILLNKIVRKYCFDTWCKITLWNADLFYCEYVTVINKVASEPLAHKNNQ